MRFICDHFDVEPDPVLQEFKKGAHLPRVDMNEELKFWNSFAVNLNRTVPEGWIELLQDIYVKELVFNHGLHAFLDILDMQGVQVALLSNQHSSYSKRFRDEGFFDHFDPQVISCEVGVAKPDLEIYRILSTQLSVLPREVLFIDDKEENLAVARLLGWNTVHYDFRHQPYEELLACFKEYGLVTHME